MGKVAGVIGKVTKDYKRAEKILRDFRGLTAYIDYQGIYNYDTRTIFYQKFLKTVASMRMKVYDEMASNPNLNKYVQELAKKDFVAWTNLFGWTYNPVHTSNSVTPFVLYQYHVDYYNKSRRNKKTIIIKSRTMGYTWLKAYIKVFRMLYEDDYKSLITSRVEGDIDIVGDFDQTIMGRIRFILDTLIYFKLNMLTVDKELIIKYRTNSIMGSSSNSDALRSKRGTELDIEEAGVIQNFLSLMASAVSVSNETRIGGTVKGTVNGFYEFWKNKDNSYLHIFWNYLLHPVFSTDDWVEKEKKKYNNDERLFRQEVLGDFFAMVGNVILTELEERFMISFKRKNFRLMRKAVSIDPGLGESNSAIWFYYYDEQRNFFYYYDYVEIEKGLAKDVWNAIDKVGFGDADNFLIDRYGGNKDSSGSSWANNLANLGAKPIYLVDNKNITGSILVANKMLREERIWFNKDNPRVELGFERLTRYVYMDRFGSDKQKKDKNADGGDSFRYSMVLPYLTKGGIKVHNRALIHKEVLQYGNSKYFGDEVIQDVDYNPLILYRSK